MVIILTRYVDDVYFSRQKHLGPRGHQKEAD